MPEFVPGHFLYRFYFFDDTNNANNHPKKDQPNNQDPTLTRMESYFERSFAHAR